MSMTPTFRSGREPYQIGALTALTVYALSCSFAFDLMATTTLRELPQPWGRVFVVLLGLATGTGLAGALQMSIMAIPIERVGLRMTAGLTIAFGLWSFGYNGFRSSVFAGLLWATGIASLVRLRQISRHRRVTQTAVTLTQEQSE